MTHKRNNKTNPKDEMRTPPNLFKKLDNRFHFIGDAAASPENTLCKLCHTKDLRDALIYGWFGVTYCNPPYNRTDLPAFVKKGYEESLKGATVVMLLPVDFSTKWWDYCMLAAEWIRIKGRIHFNGVDGLPIKGSPLFDSVVVVFDMKTRLRDGFTLSEMSWK